MKLLPPHELLQKLAGFGDFSIRQHDGQYFGRVAKDGEFMTARDSSMVVCLNLLVSGWEETEKKVDKSS